MPISPAQAEIMAQELRRIYADAEQDVLRIIARNLAEGIDDPQWATQKLASLQTVQRQIEADIARLQATGTRAVAESVNQAFLQGMESAFADLGGVGVERGAMVRTNTATAQAFVREAVTKLESTHIAILRQTSDVYRDVVTQALRPAAVGAETRRQAAQRALNQFADKGITGFVDSAGRAWQLDSYAEMATRTSLGHAAVQGHMDTLTDNGYDLVIVSDSPEACPMCDPWEGEILSLSGDSDKYPSLDDATADGLFHPNCTHRTGIYVEGLTKPLDSVSDPEGYEEKQQQRAMERNVRHWKRREAVALDDAERAKAAAKVKEWQGNLRTFVNENDRKRLYARESVTRAR